MAEQELADVQATENQTSVESAAIPAENTSQETGGEREPKKLSLRDQINKSVETVREAENRDPSTGKFTPKKDAGAKEVVAAALSKETPATETNVQPDTASKPAGPPSGWSKEAQALWDTLPPAVKADAVRREAEVAKGFNEYREKTAQLTEIEQAIAPVRHILQQKGITTSAQAVTRLLQWENMIRSNPHQAIPQLARQYGVDLSTLAQGSSEAPSSAAQEIPAHLRPVLDQFGQVAQDVTNLKSELQRSREEKVSQELTAFAKDKPHFEKVRVRMGQMIAAGAVAPTDLDGAYQQAIWADPDIRASLLKEQEEKTKADWQKQQTQLAKSARLAAVSPNTRAPAGPLVNGAAKGKGVRGSILSSIEQLREDQRA